MELLSRPELTKADHSQVAMPDDEVAPFKTQDLAANGAKLSVSHIGAKAEAEEMYRLAAEKGVRVWKEIVPMKDVAKAVQAVKNNEARCECRFPFTLQLLLRAALFADGVPCFTDRYVLKQDITN